MARFRFSFQVDENNFCPSSLKSCFKTNKLYSRARFVCAISIAFPDRSTFEYLGKIEGSITFPPRGKKGFGYDPIFIPENKRLTFGQMDPKKKFKNDHRSKAFKKIKKFL